MSESIEFQRYLESIRATYQEWQKFYTPTDAAGKQQRSKEVSPFFDFNLIVQTVKREERERQEEEIERFSVLEGLRRYADQQVLLVGRPGSGKSTALARLMLEEATNPQMGIPVLVELRYWQGSIEQLICNSLKRHGLTVERLEAVLSRLLLLFDGVNELPSEEARSQLFAFRRDHPKLPMIFTTRDLSLGGDLGIEKKLEMQPLTEAQMQGFIRAYLPEQAERMLRQLKDQLREFGQTPLLLWMLCSLFRKTGTIPENLGLVFREFTQGYERYLKEDVRIESDKAWWKPVLQQLAWVMMQGEKPTEFRVAIGKEEAVRAIAQFLNGKVPYAENFTRKCLQDLQKYHLIQAGTNPEELEYRHQLIQEYYAAEALLEQLPKLADERLKYELLNYLKWTETIALMLVLLEEAQAIRVVKLALEVDQGLASRLAGEVTQTLQEQTVGFIDVLEVSVWLKVELLAKIRTDAAIPGLLRLIEEYDHPFLLSRAADALGEIRTDTAIPGLLKLLEDADINVRLRAAHALGEIRTDTALLCWLKLLEHADLNVRLCAVDALGEFGTDRTIPGLLKLLEDDHPYMRLKAADALEKIGANVTVPDSLKLLQDDYASWSGRATDALGEGDADAVALSFLKDSDPDVRNRRSVVALEKLKGKVGIDAVVLSLIQLFEEGDLDVQRRAFNALQKIGADAIVFSLLKHLEDSDPHVCKRATDALEKIEPHMLVLSLIKLLEASDFDVRRRAADALEKIETDVAIPGLLELIENHDLYLHSRAADALVKIGADTVVLSLSYLKLLEDSDRDVRIKAANVLGAVGNDAAIPSLIKLLEDPEPIVWVYAQAALSEIAKRQAEAISQYIPHLLALIPAISGIEAYRVILAIQENCKFYNYGIHQTHLKAQATDRQTSPNNNRSHTIINTYPNVTEVKQTIMSSSSKYNFPNAQKVQIFEQVNTYIENNHPTDPEIKTAIADLTLLLTHLQTQHPQVTTESQALTVLDAEFTEIQQSTTHPLITLRQQLLNPERHLQAIKATLAEVAKHYLEESVWSKAAITYFDKLSETPDQGA